VTLFADLLPVRERVLGPEHPDTPANAATTVMPATSLLRQGQESSW
jgi:hypothetical protein